MKKQLLILGLLSTLLVACGQKGALYIQNNPPTQTVDTEKTSDSFEKK